MKYKFSIATIAFNKRFSTCFVPLLEKIKILDPDIEVVVGINGNYGEEFDQNFRRQVLEVCAKYDNVFPISFPTFRGWAKINNTMFLQASNEDILFLSDDVVIQNDNILNEVNANINGTIMTINNSFSHYICNRKQLDSYGWFDERLIGFGEEDGDLIYRFLERGQNINNIYIRGIYDSGSQIASNYSKGVGKYSKFNRDWIFTNKYVPDSSGILGTFGSPHKRICDNIQQYPTEKFYWNNRDKL